MEKVVLIAFAGMFGTLARYGLASYVQRNVTTTFPWGVFTVNMIGSFAFGLIWAYSETHGWVSENMRAVLLAGFMGAFTTFSTFAFDNSQFARASHWQFFVTNILLTNAAGIALVFAGFKAGRAI
jgi:CrcB protein